MSFKPHVLVQSPCSSEHSDLLSHCIASASSSDTRSHSRRRRRGVIEKRRRDRINDCLNELKRLIPAAREKAGSAKLEKAEILQMTVDHLRSAESSDSNNLASRMSGFQECTAEVNKYLISMEGLDIHDPLRLRLVSHLQQVLASNCYRNTINNTSNTNAYGQPWYEFGANYDYYHNNPQQNSQHNRLANNPSGYLLPTQSLYGYNNEPNSESKPSVSGSNNDNSNGGNNKPYRPWGAGMVSC